MWSGFMGASFRPMAKYNFLDPSNCYLLRDRRTTDFSFLGKLPITGRLQDRTRQPTDSTELPLGITPTQISLIDWLAMRPTTVDTQL